VLSIAADAIVPVSEPMQLAEKLGQYWASVFLGAEPPPYHEKEY
jgi:hypothetical protein